MVYGFRIRGACLRLELLLTFHKNSWSYEMKTIISEIFMNFYIKLNVSKFQTSFNLTLNHVSGLHFSLFTKSVLCGVFFYQCVMGQ